ncbi:uncharacterized protein LOC122257122 [Penaeus japonicus]|uniref:uncharacterized protein LOC122257122 n=1 Tax=Penaeus japonicus TaxID=27405 RepID=UPI001C7156BD|nr:uncharacterized protein LOC122257122 [Penaeus japonicus]
MRFFSPILTWVLVGILGERLVGSNLLGDIVNCTNKSTASSPRAADVSRYAEYVLLNMTKNFEFVQVSMKITPCLGEEETIGMHNLTNEMFDGSTSPQLMLMALQYAQEEGRHGYKLTVNKLNLSEYIATTVQCGDFVGYRVKAVGASICSLWEPGSAPTIRFSKKRTGAKGHASLSHLDELHRRTTAAYVVVLCFTLVTFFILQLTKKCSGKNTQFPPERIPAEEP